MESEKNKEKIILKPSKLRGNVTAPSSKSLTHRAIISAALTDGESLVTKVSFSKDIKATIEAVKNLGAEVVVGEDFVKVTGIFVNNRKLDNVEIYSNESASTLRFLVPITLLFTEKATFTAEKGLVQRPMSVYFDIFKKQGIDYCYLEDKLEVKGKFTRDDFIVDGSISSQFISGLLFATPLLENDSTITIKGDLQSKSYVDLTLDVISKFGIEIINEDYKVFKIKGNQSYKPKDYVVEGDYSQSSVFEIANFLGSEITIENMNPKSLQGDAVILDIVKALKENNDIVIDGSNCPDIMPIVALGACFRSFKTELINVERLKIKECDRLEVTKDILNKLGAKTEVVNNNKLVIYGGASFKGGLTLDSHNDHRIAMLIAVASTMCEEDLTLLNPSCVSKSYPNFFEVFKSIGGEVIE